MALPKNILVAIDFSECSEAALEYAVDLAAKLDARVHLFHTLVVPVIGYEAGLEVSSLMIDSAFESAQKSLERLVAAYSSRCAFGPVRVEAGDPRDQIDAAVETVKADLLVMGTHGRRGIKRWMLGSVAEVVARVASCPVLLVRDGVPS